jgi:hypothetical protein
MKLICKEGDEMNTGRVVKNAKIMGAAFDCKNVEFLSNI